MERTWGEDIPIGRKTPIRHLSSARINFIRESPPADMLIQVKGLAYAHFFRRRQGSGPVPFQSPGPLYKLIHPLSDSDFYSKARLMIDSQNCAMLYLISYSSYLRRHPPDKLATFKIVIMDLRSKKNIVSVSFIL